MPHEPNQPADPRQTRAWGGGALLLAVGLAFAAVLATGTGAEAVGGDLGVSARDAVAGDPRPAALDRARPAFPLRAGRGGASLVDAGGTPFRYLADTVWLAPSRLDQAEVRALLDARVAQGFTAVQMSVLAFLHLGGPQNAYGDPPFVGGTDLSRPLEVGTRTTDPEHPHYDYWDHVDWIVRQAADRDLALTLVPSWYGYGGEDWRPEVTTSRAADYGAFLGERLGSHPNLLWMLGGDNNPGTEDTRRVRPGGDRGDRTSATRAMGEALRRTEDVPHLMTYHAKRRVSSLVHFAGQPWHTLASAYSDELTHRHAVASRGQGLPVIVTESWYDARTVRPVLDHRRLRAEAWWSVLSGAGFAYGHEEVWDLDPTWREALDDGSADDIGRLGAILDGLGPLKPVLSVLTVPSIGSGLDQAVTGRVGTTALTYVPSRRPVTVHLDALGRRGEVTLTWINPATAERRLVGTFRPSGRLPLSWPGWADAVLHMTRH